MRAASHARPPPSRTPERRRSTSPKTSFRERYAVCKSAEKRHLKITRHPKTKAAQRFPNHATDFIRTNADSVIA
ncbi:MAG: hypothetical protein NXI28_12220 [bacterium]|nr:hypothetical protein [bacterium]